MTDPIEIHIRYRKDDYTEELERRVKDAEERANRAEYLYRCESVINAQLMDMCHENGIKVREALKMRPWEEAAAGLK